MEKASKLFYDFSIHFAFFGFLCGVDDDFGAVALYFEFGAIGFNKDGKQDAVFGFFYAHGVMHSSQGASAFFRCSSAQLNLLRSVVG